MNVPREIPDYAITVKHGKWDCSRCEAALGAVHIAGIWSYQIPRNCQHREFCKAAMKGVLETKENVQ